MHDGQTGMARLRDLMVQVWTAKDTIANENNWDKHKIHGYKQ